MKIALVCAAILAATAQGAAADPAPPAPTPPVATTTEPAPAPAAAPAPAPTPATATAPAPSADLQDAPVRVVQPEVAPPRPQSFSLSFSPLHLFAPMIELAVELRPADHLGLVVIGGIGRVSDKMSGIKAEALETGAQLNIYANEFSGIHLGVEVLYLELGKVNIDSSVAAAGVAAGPYVGYKWMTRSGFTFIGQLGGEHVIAHAQSSTNSAEAKKTIPLVNLNVGLSF